MRKNFGSKTIFYPLPVLIIGSYDKDGKVDAMNAAWGGIHDEKQIFLCLSTEHKTAQNIIEKKEFSISFATANKVVEADYIGIVSANDIENKVEKANLHVRKCENVDAPYFDEFPLTLECKVNKLDNDGTTTYIVADIVNVSADESVLTNGKIDSSKLDIISFDPVSFDYLKLGQKAGNAFRDGKKIK